MKIVLSENDRYHSTPRNFYFVEMGDILLKNRKSFKDVIVPRCARSIRNCIYLRPPKPLSAPGHKSLLDRHPEENLFKNFIHNV